ENQEQIRKCADLFEEILREQDALTLHELRVSGKDLIAAGMRPGPEVGKTLEAMLKDVIECPEHNTKEYLLEEGRFI
ncbi:MAG: polynucleotide adenylyltransferase, partial [Lachnospiraceae bacterium]|nr:polynucleotide adenylyltransferase [Lachnospiraceae bacterium]